MTHAPNLRTAYRNYPICEPGYDDGQNQTSFNKAKTYNFGYHWGRLGAEGKASGDRAGDCEFDPYIPLKIDICERAWDQGWDSSNTNMLMSDIDGNIETKSSTHTSATRAIRNF